MIEVVHFQRKRRKFGNHSFESYFKAIRESAPADIVFTPVVFKNASSGFFKRILIVIEAFFNRKQINHNTGDIHFANFLLPKKSNILTIHDCGFLKRTTGLKHIILKFFWFYLPAKRTSIITVNSNYTKADLLNYISFPEDKIIPIYIFVPCIHAPFAKIFNKAKPMILQLGTAPNKNIPAICQALNGISCTYFILGHLHHDILDALHKNNIEYKNIDESISDKEVAALYQQCDIVSFASTFEGFGMPIVEANVTGRVVVTGNVSSMPEIGADAAHYVDPYDINSIKAGFEKVINDDDYRNSLIAKGYENAKRFNRQKIANQFFDIYRSMAQKLN